MVLLLAAYVLLHSPLRQFVAKALGRTPHACYFICDGSSLVGTLGSLSAWALILTSLIAAWVVADAFGGASYERPLAFGLSAIAFVVVPAAIIAGVASWTHLGLLRAPLGPLLAMVPAVVAVATGATRGWWPRWPHGPRVTVSPLLCLIAGLAAVLVLSSMAISLLHPPNGGDGLSYHAPLAVFLWQDGNLTAFLDRAPGTWALANPGTASLWYGLLRLAAGERLADFGQLPFALLGSASAGAFTRRLGLGAGSAWLASLGYLLSPLVVMQVGMQPNDVVGAGLLMATIALASAPVATWNVRRAGLLGLGLALTITTKLALLPSVVATTGFVVAAVIWKNRGRPSASIRPLVTMASAFLLVVGPWWGRNMVRYGNPVYPAGLPLVGRGVFVSDFGKVDKEFVPHPVAWPLYPLIEPHDDRSGHGALLAVAFLPGLLLAFGRGRRQPLVVWALTVAVMLPAWWLLTMHEPRFFLAQAGLALAFVPWALAALPRRRRRRGAWLVATAATFSALVTMDQALLPATRQPTARAEFYDRVWGVDPAAITLPEREGLLQNTGYASGIPEYAGYYPLLGPSQSRRVIPMDTEGTTDLVVATMRAAHIQYAYVAASVQNHETVEAIYVPSLFELEHLSMITPGEQSGARRHLYRVTRNPSEPGAIRRYLFRLKGRADRGEGGLTPP
jgi:hypothetical protein